MTSPKVTIQMELYPAKTKIWYLYQIVTGIHTKFNFGMILVVIFDINIIFQFCTLQGHWQLKEHFAELAARYFICN